MKKNFLSRATLVVAALMTIVACDKKENEPLPEITSISVSKGSNIIFGEEITLTANSKGNITYIWTCNGGTIVGEGKTVKWVAPDEAGTYTVSVSNGDGSSKTISVYVVGASVPKPNIDYLSASKTTNVIFGEEITLTATTNSDVVVWTVSDGSNVVGEGKVVKWTTPNAVGTYTITVSNSESSSKSVEVSVVGSFYYLFDRSSSDFGIGNSNTKASVSGGVVTVYSTTTAEALFIRRELSQPSIPVSFKTKVAINVPDYMSIGTKGIAFYIIFADYEGVADSYLKGIYFNVAPGLNNHRVSIGIKTSEGTSYSTTTTQNTSIFTQNDQYHNVGMAVTENKKLVINIDGTELYRLDISAYTGSFKLENIAYQVSSGLSLLIDDFYFTNDGTILK